MDRDLVEAAQRGDQEAFVDLVQPHGDRLYAIAHRILRDVDRAEDALQDALVIAWRDLPSLRDPDRFDAWLHRVLTTCASARRRASVAGSHTCGCCRSTGRPPPTTCSAWPIATSSTAGSGGCAPDERAILVLHHFLGYPLSEIAESARHPATGRSARDSSRTSRHAGRPRCRARDRPSSEDLRHERTLDIERVSNTGSTTARRRIARPRPRRGRRPDRASTAAARVARPQEGLPT